MRCLLLAAGYATRLYPLTRDMPKSLLEVGGRTILERLLEKIREVHEVEETILVSNSRFAAQFETFLFGRRLNKGVSVLDDGTRDNESRLGAIGDMALAISERSIDDDLMVLAGDNLFDFSLADFTAFFHHANADCVTAHLEKSLAALRKTGVAELDKSGRVLSFEEKPSEPKSNYAVPPFYLYRKDTLAKIGHYLEQGNDPDAPGQFIQWLVKRSPVFAFRFEGRRYDIGNLESYRKAQELFG